MLADGEDGDAQCSASSQVPRSSSPHFRMLIARAATISASTRLAAASTIISTFAQWLSGSVSVGLNAVAFVNDRKR